MHPADGASETSQTGAYRSIASIANRRSFDFLRFATVAQDDGINRASSEDISQGGALRLRHERVIGVQDLVEALDVAGQFLHLFAVAVGT
jgi:hypothetical protein